MNTVAVIFLYAIIGSIETVSLYKNNPKKECVLYEIALLTAFIISLLLSAGVELPNPADYIRHMVERLVG